VLPSLLFDETLYILPVEVYAITQMIRCWRFTTETRLNPRAMHMGFIIDKVAHPLPFIGVSFH